MGAGCRGRRDALTPSLPVIVGLVPTIHTRGTNRAKSGSSAYMGPRNKCEDDGVVGLVCTTLAKSGAYG